MSRSWGQFFGMKCGDLDFWMPYSRGECGDFASVQLRGDWEWSTVRSIDGKMAEEKFRTAYKLLRTEKVDFFFNIHKNVNFWSITATVQSTQET